MTVDQSTPPRRLYRSSQNRVLAGVCGGIAEYSGADPTAVRLLAVVIGLITGIVPLLIVYLVAAIVVPERGGAGAAPAPGIDIGVGAGSAGLILGVVLILVGIAGVANVVLRIDWNLVWPFVLIGLGVFVVAVAVRRG